MKKLLLTLLLMFGMASAAVADSFVFAVMVDSDGVIVSPTNLFKVNIEMLTDMGITTNPVIVLHDGTNYRGIQEFTGDGITRTATGFEFSGGVTEIPDPLTTTNLVFAFSGEQVLSEGGTIQPFGNVRISANETVALGNPQIVTNGITDGTMMFLRAASETGDINIEHGRGVVLDCDLNFRMTAGDIMQFIFFDGVWREIKRIDK